MAIDTGAVIDTYVTELCTPQDEVLLATLEATKAGGLPPIQIPPTLGKLLHILVRCSGANKILEIGTLGGYSAIWMARALKPGGRLLSLEISPEHAAVARQNVERAGLSDCIEVRVGPALEQLPGLVKEGPFDVVYIDADKESYPQYLDWALKLTHAGSLIIGDNVLRGGHVIDPQPEDAGAQAIHLFNEKACTNPRLTTIILPNRNGRDGVLIAYVK